MGLGEILLGWKVTLEQGREGNEGASQVDIWGRAFQTVGTVCVKALRLEHGCDI